MWTSVQVDSLEPDYSSIEELFCLPVTESKAKGSTPAVKQVPKEVDVVLTYLIVVFQMVF